MKEFKIIPSGKTARHLLRLGYEIVDVKASKWNKDMTIFIFRNSESLEKELLQFENKENTQLTKGEENHEYIRTSK